jgi:hypothetical protein
MTYFPQPHPANRERRLKVGGSVVVAIRSEGARVVRAKLHELSTTGGLLLLSKAFEQGDFVEVAFPTSKGTVHGMAELLAARCESTSGCLQPFRFVALPHQIADGSGINFGPDYSWWPVQQAPFALVG